jgi:RNA 3'-terminal phosphate cyclase (ATP)
VLEIDASRYSGSGTIVRQAIAFAALTGTDVRIINVRVRRPKPGLRRQHVQVVESIRQLVGGASEGGTLGSQEVVFLPGKPTSGGHYVWDIGSAGSTTALALAIIPVLAFRPFPTFVELRGGLFQDYAPSFYHLEQVILPLLRGMGIELKIRMERPGYVPAGGGILHLEVTPVRTVLKTLILDRPGPVKRIWGVALSSRLKHQSVSDRMADAAKGAFADAGYHAQIDVHYDDMALQPGAGFAAFADLIGGSRLGADRAGAPGRRSEAIGKYVARQLLEDVRTGATVDRYASDQIIPFAALASGKSLFRIPRVSDHIQSSAWLSEEFLGAKISIARNELAVKGIGFKA